MSEQVKQMLKDKIPTMHLPPVQPLPVTKKQLAEMQAKQVKEAQEKAAAALASVQKQAASVPVKAKKVLVELGTDRKINVQFVLEGGDYFTALEISRICRTIRFEWAKNRRMNIIKAQSKVELKELPKKE